MMSKERFSDLKNRFLKINKPFIIGTAASAHQVEGNNNNDWTNFELYQGKVKNNDQSGKATNHYELFDEDFKILEDLGFQAHRLSIEWSRIFPKSDQIDQKEIDHYREVLQSLHSHNQISFVSLHHFTSPQWFVDLGGFKKKDNLKYWEEYVKTVCDHLGDFIDVFNTINEPFIYCATAYLSGVHAPGETGILNYLKVGNNIMRAHFKAVEIVRSICPDKPVGLVKNLINFRSKPGWNPLNKILRGLTDWGYNSQPLKSLKNQRIPFGFKKIPYGDMGDFIGINYYVKVIVGFGYDDYMLTHDIDAKRLTQMGWGVNPEAMKDEIIRLQKFVDLPVFITENGIATDDDSWREEYIEVHLDALLDLIEEGIDIRGYFYWSNIDNFEWSEGFHPKFGLISYDPDTFERTIKPSGKSLGKLAKQLNNTKGVLDFKKRENSNN